MAAGRKELSLTPRDARSDDRTVPRRRWLRWLLLAFLGAIPCGILLGGGALVCQPRWYSLAAVDYVRLAEDKRALIGLVESIGQAFQDSRSIEIKLTADQINRWIAARHELSPQDWIEADLSALDQFSGLHVSFLSSGEIRIAGRVTLGSGFATILWAKFRVEPDNDQIQIAIGRVGMGLLPVPSALVDRALGPAVAARPGEVERTAHGWRAPNNLTWPNGKRHFRISAFSVSDNLGVLTLEPLPRVP